jgi:hypothetical protein
MVDLEGVDGHAVGARVDLRGEDVDTVGGQAPRDEREEARHVARDDDEVRGAQIAVMEELGDHRPLFETLDEPQMGSDSRGGRGGEIPVGDHGEVPGHGIPEPGVAQLSTHPLGHVLARVALELAAGEPREGA